MNALESLPVWGSAALIALHVLFLLYILYRKTGDPSGAAFWLMTAAVFPLGGFVLFLFFGMSGRRRMTFHIAKVHAQMRYAHARQRLLGEAVARQDRALARFIADTPEARSPRNAMLDRLFPEAPLLTGNRTELLVDGTEAYPRMLADIAAAKVSIRLQSFILMASFSTRWRKKPTKASTSRFCSTISAVSAPISPAGSAGRSRGGIRTWRCRRFRR